MSPSGSKLSLRGSGGVPAEIFTEPLPKAKNGIVDLPTKPGMGLALDKKKLARYRLT